MTSPGSRLSIPGLVILTASVALFGVAWAQESLPPDLPAPSGLPELSRFELPNGAEVIVAEHHEQPFVSLSLVFPGGAAADPPDREGTAEMVANLLTSGTLNRSAAQVTESVERMGATMEGAVGLDWTTIRVEALSPTLDDLLVILADAVRYPLFPADEVDRLRARMMQGLVLAESTPTAVAARQLVREVFDEHPYGRLATGESLRAISRADLVDYHARQFRPDGAVFVVSGDVDVPAVEASLTRVFGDWVGSTPRSRSPEPAPEIDSRRIVLVDLPGAAQATVALGRAFPSVGTDARRSAALDIATEAVGGPTHGRLVRSLREERGWSYSVVADAGRRAGPGLFRVETMVRYDAVDSALIEISAELGRMGTEPIPATELDDVTAFLAGSFPLQLETPPQIAAQVLRYHLLGVDPSLLDGYRAMVSSVSAEEVRRVAAETFDPAELVIVVVGDRARLQPGLDGLGALEVVAPDGRPLDDLRPEDVRSTPASPTAVRTPVDATALRAGRSEFQVLAQGRPLGRMVREISIAEVGNEAIVTVSSSMELGPLGYSRQTVSFTAADFSPTALTRDATLPGSAGAVDLRVIGDSIHGIVRGPNGPERPFGAPLRAGAVIGEMQEVALWLTDLTEGKAVTVPVMATGEDRVREMRAVVIGEREIEVPAGTFDVWEVEITLEGAPQRVFLSRDAPHLLVRLGADDAPLRLELASSGER